MGRPRKGTSEAVAARIVALRRCGRTATEIAAQLAAEGTPLSRATVERRVLELTGRVHAERATVRQRPGVARRAVPAVAHRVAPAVTREELLAAEAAAESDEEAAECTLALLRFDDPDLARFLDQGAALVDALLSAGHFAPFTLRRPADLAALVALLVEDPCSFERDTDQSEDDFAEELRTAGEAEHARAVGLLKDALAIVRAAGIPKRYRP
jgi:hypothetical protein